MATSSKRAYAIPESAVPRAPAPAGPLLTHTSTGHTETQFCLSLCGVSGSWCTQGLFEPSECLWQVWGLILNMISPFLPSCWGFSLVLGSEVSPHCHLSAVQPPPQHLPSCWGFSFALGCGVSFFGGIQHSPVDSCSAVSCNFGVLAGEDEHTSFYSAIFLHHTHKVFFFFFFFF